MMLEVCNIFTISLISCSLSFGIFNQWLKALAKVILIAFPGVFSIYVTGSNSFYKKNHTIGKIQQKQK